MDINILKIGFKLNLISRMELLNWSDNNLVEGNEENIFIELSSINSKAGNDVIISVLEKYENFFIIKNFDLFHAITLSFIVSELNDWHHIQLKLIDYFQLIKDKICDNDFGFWTSLKDDIQLKKEGLPGCLKIPRDLKNYINSKNIMHYNNTYLNTIIKNIDHK